MEPLSQTRDTADARAILEDQLRECYGRVVYTHKTHEKCADILLSRLSKLKISQITLSAVTTAGFIAVVFGAGTAGTFAGAIVSTLLLVLNAYMKNCDLGELAQKHRQAGADIWIIREKYLSLISDLLMGGKPIEVLQKERDGLLEETYRVYSEAPSTTYKAYTKAQKALKELDDMTFSDKEIDSFLPKRLKKNSRIES